jgi:hypothetical protein
MFAALVHPLMVWFAFSYCVLWLVSKGWPGNPVTVNGVVPLVFLLLPRIFYPTSTAYHEAIRFHENHYVLQWQWYEWLGAVAPIGISWLLMVFARKREMLNVARACGVLTIYGVLYFAAALVISIPHELEALARWQPLRSLHLFYMLLIIIGGGFLAEYLLQARAWRWAVLFVPLCAGMFIAQRSLFPASNHVEWPWIRPKNLWEQAFLWIRKDTPLNAVFAIDPVYVRLNDEDTVAFRPTAERSSIADGYKDSGTVSMFPPLADLWWEQFQAERNWTNFGLSDFMRLKQRYGVNWVVLQSPGVIGVDCPYRNREVMVCRLP